MTAVLIAIIGTTVIGLPIALATARDLDPIALPGAAFLLGSGAVFIVMFVLPWNLPLLVAALLALSAAAWWWHRRRARTAGGDAHDASPRPAMVRIPRPLAALGPFADAATVVTVAGYALFATVATPWEWDFSAIWGLKGRVFFEHGGMDWAFLDSRWNGFQHPEYPVLVPFQFDFAALLAGGWNDRWFGLFFVAWAVAAIVIVRGTASREVPAPFPALISLAVAALVCTRYVGLAEGAIIAFGTAAVLMLRRGNVMQAALMLGFAANAKQEGVALLIATVLALLIAQRWRDAIRLWPAVVLAAPWAILAAVHGRRSYLIASGFLGRIASRIAQSASFAALLAQYTPDIGLWIAVLLSVLVCAAAVRRREAPYIMIVILQLGATILAYYMTPYGVEWQIVTSWARLERQVLPIAAFLALLMLAKTFLGENNHAHAEARSNL